MWSRSGRWNATRFPDVKGGRPTGCRTAARRRGNLLRSPTHVFFRTPQHQCAPAHPWPVPASFHVEPFVAGDRGGERVCEVAPDEPYVLRPQGRRSARADFFPALHGSFRAASPSARARLHAPSSLRPPRIRPARPRRAPRDPLFHGVHDDPRRPAQRVDFRVRGKVFRRARHVSSALPQNSWAEIKGFSGRLPGLAPGCAMCPVEMPIPALPPGRSSNRRSPPGIQFPGDRYPRIHWSPTPAKRNFPLPRRRGSATGALERDTRIPVSGVALQRSSTNETHRLISPARTSARFPG